MPVYTSDRLMVGCPGVAPGYVDLESTRSHGDPHPISAVKSTCGALPVFLKIMDCNRFCNHLAFNVCVLLYGSKF